MCNDRLCTTGTVHKVHRVLRAMYDGRGADLVLELGGTDQGKNFAVPPKSQNLGGSIVAIF